MDDVVIKINNQIEAEPGVSKGKSMSRIVDDRQFACCRKSGQLLGPLRGDDPIVSAMEQEGGRPVATLVLFEPAFVEKLKIGSQEAGVHGKTAVAVLREVAVAMEVMDQCCWLSGDPCEHPLDMAPGESTVGRGCAMKVGEAADYGQHRCATDQMLRHEVRSQRVTNDDQAGGGVVVGERRRLSPIASVANDRPGVQESEPSVPAGRGEAPAMLQGKTH